MVVRFLPTWLPKIRWRPVLPGSNLRDRMSAAGAAMIGVVLTGGLSALALRHGLAHPYLVAPIGASAVLVFVAPASPLAQPWSAFGGNVVAALAAFAAGQVFAQAWLAVGVALALAILAMSALRCLHPPGGAVALVTALAAGGQPAPGLTEAVVPIALNTAILVAAAWIYHRFVSGHSWPHHAAQPPSHGTRDPAPGFRYGLREEDIEEAVAEMHDAFDIAREDLAQLLHKLELRVFSRAHGAVRCADIMSRDILSVRENEPLRAAIERARARRLHSLPVVDASGRAVGMLDAPDFADIVARPDAHVGDVMRPALTVAPEAPAFSLLGPLGEGRAHAAMVIDAEGRLAGLVTQTDLLSALAEAALVMPAAGAA